MDAVTRLYDKLTTVKSEERKRLFKLKRLINKSKIAEALEIIEQCLEETKPARMTMRQGSNFLQTAVRNGKLSRREEPNPIIVQIMKNY